MNTNPAISTKNFFFKLNSLFQFRAENNQAIAPQTENMQTRQSNKAKLQVSLEDLKTISTALLHFKRLLSRRGEEERADEVAQIDQRFYNLILKLEKEENTEKTPTETIGKDLKIAA